MNLAIFLPNWIGDVVMATPAIRALREHFAPSRCIAVCRPYVADVLEGSPWFDAHLFLEPSGPWAHRLPAVSGRLRHEKIPHARFLPSSIFAPWRFATINLRNHRKILGIDGRIAFTGGMNIRHGNVIAQKPKRPVQDLHFRVEGPAVLCATPWPPRPMWPKPGRLPPTRTQKR